MIDKFLEGVGSKLADKAVVSILSPAFLFSAVGLGAWVYGHGRADAWRRLTAWIRGALAADLLILLVLLMFLLLAAGLVVQRLTFPVLRLLEGYWPRQFRRWADKRVANFQELIKKKETEFQALARKRDAGGLTPEESDRYVALDDELARFPSDSSRFLPTRLGNVLRSSESRPKEKYELDAPEVWVCFVLVIPEALKSHLESARSHLDNAVASIIWSALLVVWCLWAWWTVAIAVVAAWTIWRWWLLEAATRYGDLVEASFDTNRFRLYEALRLPLPSDPKHERTTGKQLTEYLARGSDLSEPKFQYPTPK